MNNKYKIHAVQKASIDFLIFEQFRRLPDTICGTQPRPIYEFSRRYMRMV